MFDKQTYRSYGRRGWGAAWGWSRKAVALAFRGQEPEDMESGGVIRRGRINCKLLFKTFQVRKKDEMMITCGRNRMEGRSILYFVFILR